MNYLQMFQNNSMGKEQSSTNGVRLGYPYGKIMISDLFLTKHLKVNYRPKCKTYSYKRLDEIIRIHFTILVSQAKNLSLGKLNLL